MLLAMLVDYFYFRISELPEDLPQIDFSAYAKRITNTAMLQEFEKMVIPNYMYNLVHCLYL